MNRKFAFIFLIVIMVGGAGSALAADDFPADDAGVVADSNAPIETRAVGQVAPQPGDRMPASDCSLDDCGPTKKEALSKVPGNPPTAPADSDDSSDSDSAAGEAK